MPYTDPEAKRKRDREYYLAHQAERQAAERERGRLVRAGEREVEQIEPIKDRLLRYVQESPTGCWVWTGGRNARGYGRLNVRGIVQLVHRVSYEAHVGPIPDGMTIDHLCRVHACINPAHLEVVTALENWQRGPGQRLGWTCGHDPARIQRRADGRAVYCKDCRNTERRERYRDDPAYREAAIAKSHSTYQRSRLPKAGY